MKAVIYARYSSDNQREESIEGQIRECTAYAEKNSITVLKHYIDRAMSAKTDDRPDFQHMIKDSEKGLFDLIIVWKLDRFSRDRYDSAHYKHLLKKNGVKVVSATELIADGPEGIMMESILEGMNEYYSAELSVKIRRGLMENALKGKFVSSTAPIGYVIDAEHYLQIDPLKASFVREAFQKYADGATMKEIRDWLNEHHVTSSRGKPITFNTVQLMLNNRRYIGEYHYNEIVVPGGHPAIVDEDLFNRVQERLAVNKKAPARHKAEDDYLLTTKLFCGNCGAMMRGECGTARNGATHHYYKCATVKRRAGTCHKKTVRKAWIEDLIVTETMKLVMNDKAIDAIVALLMDYQDRDNVNLPLYEKQLREAEKGIENLVNAIQQGIFTKSTRERLEQLESLKEELEQKIALEKLEKPRISEEFMRFWLLKFRKLDIRQQSHRKMLIDTFVNAVFLYDDKLVLTFNFKDGTRTMTMDDLVAASRDGEKDAGGSDMDEVTPLPEILDISRVSGFLLPFGTIIGTVIAFQSVEKHGHVPELAAVLLLHPQKSSQAPYWGCFKSVRIFYLMAQPIKRARISDQIGRCLCLFLFEKSVVRQPRPAAGRSLSALAEGPLCKQKRIICVEGCQQVISFRLALTACLTFPPFCPPKQEK